MFCCFIFAVTRFYLNVKLCVIIRCIKILKHPKEITRSNLKTLKKCCMGLGSLKVRNIFVDFSLGGVQVMTMQKRTKRRTKKQKMKIKRTLWWMKKQILKKKRLASWCAACILTFTSCILNCVSMFMCYWAYVSEIQHLLIQKAFNIVCLVHIFYFWYI